VLEKIVAINCQVEVKVDFVRVTSNLDAIRLRGRLAPKTEWVAKI